MAEKGRPSEFTEETLETAKDYLSSFKSHYDHEIPSVVGLGKVLRKSRETLYDWANPDSDRYKGPEFSDILRQINTDQHFELVNGGLNGRLNPQITKLVLGKHGYHEQHKQEISGPEGGPIEGNVVFVGATETD